MAAMKRLKAHRYQIQEPLVGWIPFNDRRIVISGISKVDEVLTTHGLMTRVTMTTQADFANPSTDIAAMVGHYLTEHGREPAELWRWGDNYWMKARDPAGYTWYKKQCFLLYKVDVSIPLGFIEQMSVEREQFLFTLPK